MTGVEALAARYFAEQQEPAYRASGMPEDGINHLRNQYVRDACASPEAVQQLRDLYEQPKDGDAQ